MMFNHIKFENGRVRWKQIEKRNGLTFVRIVQRKQDIAGLPKNNGQSEIFSISK